MPEKPNQMSQVLILTEDRSRTRYVEEVLRGSHEVTVVIEGEASGDTQGNDATDLIIVDLAGRGAIDTCRSLKRQPQLAYVPIVVITDDEELSVQALAQGAIDCLPRKVNRGYLAGKVGNLVSWKRAHDVHLKAETDARDRVEELESFVQMVTHDLKSPVIAAHGFVKLLAKNLEQTAPDEKTVEILSHLSNACRKMQDFVNDLSQLFVIENTPIDWRPIALDRAVREVVEQHKQSIFDRRIALEVDLGDYRGGVMGDRHRITQVLDNLVSNAIRHMGDVPDAMIRVELEDAGDAVITRVADNGVGIPQEYHDKIFRRFFRVPLMGAKPGTGLGLAIAKTIVESHRGRLWIEPGSQRGVTFSFSLPKAPASVC